MQFKKGDRVSYQGKILTIEKTIDPDTIIGYSETGEMISALVYLCELEPKKIKKGDTVSYKGKILTVDQVIEPDAIIGYSKTGEIIKALICLCERL